MTGLFDGIDLPAEPDITHKERCGFCGQDGDQLVILMDDGPHYAKVKCRKCGRQLRWLSKPEQSRAKRPAAHTELVRKFGQGFCEMCLIREDNLPKGETLEAQHVVEFKDGGEPTRENIWVICTACHKLIHWRRTYVGHLLQGLADAMKRWKHDETENR